MKRISQIPILAFLYFFTTSGVYAQTPKLTPGPITVDIFASAFLVAFRNNYSKQIWGRHRVTVEPLTQYKLSLIGPAQETTVYQTYPGSATEIISIPASPALLDVACKVTIYSDVKTASDAEFTDYASTRKDVVLFEPLA